MKYCLEIDGYNCVLASTPEIKWAITISKGGEIFEPLNEIAETLDDAKLRACRRVSDLATLDYDDSVCGEFVWTDCSDK